MGKHHDLVNFTKRFKAEKHSFFMDVASWKTFAPPIPLTWSRVPFGVKSQPKIPQVRGVYVFTVEVPGIGLPQHGYILYVGETGNTSEATLRSRYGAYLGYLRNEDGRPAVFYMLKNWENALIFNFVEVPDTSVDVKAIQDSFIDALIPPINKKDMKATIKAGKAAEF
jgi:hypothetical protein